MNNLNNFLFRTIESTFIHIDPKGNSNDIANETFTHWVLYTKAKGLNKDWKIYAPGRIKSQKKL